MDSYVAIVFDSAAQAAYGLEQIWKLNRNGDLTVHGAAIVRRDDAGRFEVANKRTFTGLRTIAGTTAGALAGMLMGPAGLAAAAYAGAVAGLAADVVKSAEHREAVDELEAALRRNQAAIVAEISEDKTSALNEIMGGLHGRVFRRRKDEMRESFFVDVSSESSSEGYFADPSG